MLIKLLFEESWIFKLYLASDRRSVSCREKTASEKTGERLSLAALLLFFSLAVFQSASQPNERLGELVYTETTVKSSFSINSLHILKKNHWHRFFWCACFIFFRRYNNLFRFLLKVKRTQLDLQQVWAAYMGTKHLSTAQLSNMTKIWLARMHMAFLIDNLQYYLQVSNLSDIIDWVLAIVCCHSFSWDFCV